jgi:hypothetical protein
VPAATKPKAAAPAEKKDLFSKDNLVKLAVTAAVVALAAGLASKAGKKKKEEPKPEPPPAKKAWAWSWGK